MTLIVARRPGELDIEPAETGPFPLTHSAALAAMNKLGSFLYAVRWDDGMIKIGITRQLGKRIGHLDRERKMGAPEVLAIKRGDFDDEQTIHQHLADHRARGREWYHPTPEVLAVINEWRADLGRPPIE